MELNTTLFNLYFDNLYELRIGFRGHVSEAGHLTISVYYTTTGQSDADMKVADSTVVKTLFGPELIRRSPTEWALNMTPIAHPIEIQKLKKGLKAFYPQTFGNSIVVAPITGCFVHILTKSPLRMEIRIQGRHRTGPDDAGANLVTTVHPPEAFTQRISEFIETQS